MALDKTKILQSAESKMEEKIKALRGAIGQEELDRKEAPSAMESKSDTTKSQKEVLIRGLEEQLESMRLGLKALKSVEIAAKNHIELGALFETEIEETNERAVYFVCPYNLGEMNFNGKDIYFISNTAPFFKELKDKRAGDSVSIASASGRIYRYKVLSVC
ncbi:MAG: hypothetical protein M1127_02920 [Patescibacteria group bacterium]|nr:hypothetical protein [Patescibacteria group bacterium]